MTIKAATRPSFDFIVPTPKGATKARRIIVVKGGIGHWSVWWRRERAEPVLLGTVRRHWNCKCAHPCAFTAVDVPAAPGYDRVDGFRRYLDGERGLPMRDDARFACWIALKHLGSTHRTLRSAVDALATLTPRRADRRCIP
jgi:hypothetical protein